MTDGEYLRLVAMGSTSEEWMYEEDRKELRRIAKRLDKLDNEHRLTPET